MVELAERLGADYSLVGEVQKVSNLIQSMNLALREADSGNLVRMLAVDIRGNTDEAWPRMTADYQRTRTGGRRAYEGFWNGIDRVSVSQVRATPPSRVDATITYRRSSGVSVERTRYRLVREDGILKGSMGPLVAP